jgi:hypothetical protein
MLLLIGILTDAFGCPRGHPKAKPFVDRVMSFFSVKGSICKYMSFLLCTDFENVNHSRIKYKGTLVIKLISSLTDDCYALGIRNYQIIDKSDRGEDTNLVEIGPRMVTPTFD